MATTNKPKKEFDNPFVNLPAETMIDVVFTKGDDVIIVPMTFREALATKPKPGWKKTHYQTGQHGFTATKIFDKTK